MENRIDENPNRWKIRIDGKTDATKTEPVKNKKVLRKTLGLLCASRWA